MIKSKKIDYFFKEEGLW